jgi:hypothetical protein
MVMGMFEKNYDAGPVTFRTTAVSISGKAATISTRRTIFQDATSFVAPNSWFGKGLILQYMTEDCQGNSMCLYVTGSEHEEPSYMSENASNFTVRSWRPVQAWQQKAGLQAYLQRVPSHPTFYVVSPCFAVAKVWKTEMDGEKTIFIKPEKVNMSTNNSNYCYADSNLVSSYVKIWAAEDVLTVVEAVVSWGISSGKIVLEEAAKLVAKDALEKFGLVDPVSLVAAMAEASISWPGPPFTGLDYDTMNENTDNVEAFNELKEAMKEQYG